MHEIQAPYKEFSFYSFDFVPEYPLLKSTQSSYNNNHAEETSAIPYTKNDLQKIKWIEGKMDGNGWAKSRN